MTSRIQNGNALRAFIGSLLVPDSYNQQYLWIRGPGGDSKGAINRWLANAFGHSYASKRPPKEGEQFWSYGILGKRVVALPDADSGRFVRYGLWLSLTGGDPIEVEAKGQQSFTYQPNAKFIVISNKRPNVSSERAHQRRLLYCEMTGKWDELTAQEIQTFEQKLWQEGGAFLAKCLNYYHQAYPNSGPIKAESSQDLEGWISVVEEEFETLFAHEFKLLSEQSEWVRPADMQRVLLSTLKQRDRQLEFLDWMERKHGVRKISIRCSDGRIVKVYQNITLKPRSTV